MTDQQHVVDPQLQALTPDPAIEAALDRDGQTYREMIELTLNGYASRPALAERCYDIRDGWRHYRPEFQTTSYAQLHERIAGLAAAWGPDETHGVAPGEFVAILGFSGIDYFTVLMACAFAHATAVPLQTTLAGADLDGIFTDTAPVTVAATVSDLSAAIELAEAHPSVRSVVAFEYDERVEQDQAQYVAARDRLAAGPSRAQLITLSELTARGDAATWQPPEPDPDRIVMLMHSSGSTGTPKGAIVTEGYATSRIWSRAGAPEPLVRLAFAPLNHGMGIASVTSTLTRGGTCHFTARPDLSLIFEDFALVRPTSVAFFPRILEMLHQRFLAAVARRSREDGDPAQVRVEVSAGMQGMLGDRLRVALVGSAATTPELKRFMQETFAITLLDSYGSTEAGIVTIGEQVQRKAIVDYRLRDVPELGYHTTDKPHPRGELGVKTRLDPPAYFKRPEATARLFDEDGFLLTGDIMEQPAPDRLVFVDRRNDVMKLAQGEYVATGRLATTFESESSLVEQMYVHGNSARAYLVAVVVPNLDVARAQLGGGDVAEHDLRMLIRSELKRVGALAGLRSFEVPRDFIVEREPFTHENGLLSSVHKRLRPALRARYGGPLEELYAKVEAEQSDAIADLQDPDSELSVIEKVTKALVVTLGVEDIDPHGENGFVDLGGDSLGAGSFAALLLDVFGVTLTVNAVLSPAGNPTAWAQAIEAALADDGPGVASFAAIHGPEPATISAAQLDIANFLPPDSVITPAPATDVRTVLLTGATGFLGRFVCLEWLQRLSEIEGGKLVCLVRASSQDAAEQRLASVFAGDPALRARYRELAAGRLDVVVGDVAEPRLGLAPDDYTRLAGEVDRITHVGALVNHMLSYSDLFGPNVTGVANLIGFALAERVKPIDFVSSLAAALYADGPAGHDEDAPLLPEIALREGYGSGYAASKWAGEQLLHSAHRRFGLPVNVLRGDMMLAHRRYRGQINVPDVFTRLLFSVITTGLAPLSFYAKDANGGRARAHYDGLPVDFVAASIVAIGSAPADDEVRTYHVTNPHDDGRSLDTFVDWIEDAGYPIHRIADHEVWRTQFESALRSLPEDQRRHSSLSVVDALSSTGAGVPSGGRRFRQAVESLEVAPQIPSLDRAFIEKCLADLRHLDLIGAPSGTRTGAEALAPAPA